MLTKHCLSVFAAGLLSYSATGQILRRPAAALYTGAGAYSINHTDVFSFTANQAALAQLKNPATAVYAERKFMLQELASYTAVAGITTKSGNFGLQANYSGFSSYNETKIGLAYGRKLGSRVNAGIQFNYNGIRIAGYGTASAITVEAGTILHLTDQLSAGIHVNNPAGGKFGNHKEEKLPAVYTVGAGYAASDKFFISTEIIKEEDQPVNVNAGLQYSPLSKLIARVGVASSASVIYAGVGLSFSSFRVDITASYHNQLGLTPGLLLLFDFKNKED